MKWAYENVYRKKKQSYDNVYHNTGTVMHMIFRVKKREDDQLNLQFN